jgi:hypothetical protein
MPKVSHTFTRPASHHIARVAYLLNRAEHHLSAARSKTLNRYQREQFDRLTRDLRSIGSPLARIASAIESGYKR